MLIDHLPGEAPAVSVLFAVDGSLPPQEAATLAHQYFAEAGCALDLSGRARNPFRLAVVSRRGGCHAGGVGICHGGEACAASAWSPGRGRWAPGLREHRRGRQGDSSAGRAAVPGADLSRPGAGRCHCTRCASCSRPGAGREARAACPGGMGARGCGSAAINPPCLPCRCCSTLPVYWSCGVRESCRQAPFASTRRRAAEALQV
jgi:hypothetical protein